MDDKNENVENTSTKENAQSTTSSKETKNEVKEQVTSDNFEGKVDNDIEQLNSKEIKARYDEDVNNFFDAEFAKDDNFRKEYKKNAFDKFISEKGIDAKSVEDLDDAQRKEYEEMAQTELDKHYEEFKTSIIQITKRRKEKVKVIAEDQKKLKEFLEEFKKENETLMEKLASETDPDKIKSLQTKINERNELLAKYEKKYDDLSKKIADSFKDHEKVQEAAKKGLVSRYPEKTKNDPDIANVFEKDEKEQEAPKQEQQKAEQQKAEQQKDKQQGKEVKAQSGATAQSQGETHLKGPYVPDELDAGTSRRFLNMFVTLSTVEQMEYLKHPDSKSGLMTAMRNAGNTLNPIAALRFNKTRKKLLSLSKDPMMKEALEEMNIKEINLPEGKTIEDAYNEKLEEYKKEKAEIDKTEDKTEKTAMQNALNEKYKGILGVEEFKRVANETMSKSYMKVVGEKLGITRESEEPKAIEAASTVSFKREEQTSKSFRDELKGSVVPEKEQIKNYKETEEQHRNVQEKQKTTQDGPSI